MRTVSVPQSLPCLPRLAVGACRRGRLRITQDVSWGLCRHPSRESGLPGGNSVPPLVRGSVHHVDTAGVHMLGHLEDLIEFVVQGRLASRSRQRIFTRSQSKFVCTHNEYWYTSARAQRKCANLTITCQQRGEQPSPLDRTTGYPGGMSIVRPPAEDGYLQQNRWQIGRDRSLPK